MSKSHVLHRFVIPSALPAGKYIAHFESDGKLVVDERLDEPAALTPGLTNPIDILADLASETVAENPGLFAKMRAYCEQEVPTPHHTSIEAQEAEYEVARKEMREQVFVHDEKLLNNLCEEFAARNGRAFSNDLMKDAMKTYAMQMLRKFAK